MTASTILPLVDIVAHEEQHQVVAARGSVVAVNESGLTAEPPGALVPARGPAVCRVDREARRVETSVGTGRDDARVAETNLVGQVRVGAETVRERLWRRNLENVGVAPRIEDGRLAGKAVDRTAVQAVEEIVGEAQTVQYGVESARLETAIVGEARGVRRRELAHRVAHVGATPAALAFRVPARERLRGRPAHAVSRHVGALSVLAFERAVEVGGDEQVGETQLGRRKAGDAAHVAQIAVSRVGERSAKHLKILLGGNTLRLPAHLAHTRNCKNSDCRDNCHDNQELHQREALPSCLYISHLFFKRESPPRGSVARRDPAR